MLVFEMSEEFIRAGLLLRVISRVLDLIIIAAVAEIIPRAGFFAGLVYLLIGDGLFQGQSLGKKLIGLKVISIDTEKQCSIRDSILRNGIFGIGYLLYKIPFFGWIFILIIFIFEFIILLGSKEKMRLGDEIAKTIVVITETGAETERRRTDAS
ncbi:MAG: RDD family protein [Thermodesulfovibrionales bacterium]